MEETRSSALYDEDSYQKEVNQMMEEPSPSLPREQPDEPAIEQTLDETII